MVIEEETLDTLIDAATSTDADVRTDYSGDFMFGKQCFGIVGDTHDYGAFLVNLAEEDSELARELANSVRTDGMGMSSIFYWEHLQIENEEDSE